MQKVLAVDLLEALSREVKGETSAERGGVGMGEQLNHILEPRGRRASSGGGLEEVRGLGGSVEIPQAIRSSCTNVVEKPHLFVARDLALGKNMETSREVLGSVGLLGHMQEPAGLRKLMVAIEARSIKRLLEHFLDSRFAPAQRSML